MRATLGRRWLSPDVENRSRCRTPIACVFSGLFRKCLAHSRPHAFILPTLYEPFSNACLEALAFGLPVLTTEHNGFAEIIDRGVEGEVFSDPRDTAALAAGIDRWADAARRAEVRPRLLEKAARFTIEENVRSTLAIIEKARESDRTA